MNTYFLNVFSMIEQVAHPAAGKTTLDKKKKRRSANAANPKASPDSQNMRELVRKQDGFRRNPAP